MSGAGERGAPHIDMSEAEHTYSEVAVPAVLSLPINDEMTVCRRGDGFIVAAICGGDARRALVAVGIAGQAGFHCGADAASLRAFAAQAMRCADMLDDGRGKQ